MIVSSKWFAVHTGSCQEKRAAQHLSTREIEHFLPVSRNARRWKNGCTMLLDQPLFPGYLFVKISRLERVRVLELPGVHSIVGNGREPIPLPYSEIESTREGNGFVNVESFPFMNVGEIARILSLELIAKSISVEVSADDVEPIDSPSRVLVGSSTFASDSY